jgi:hypothetical protein
MMRTALAVRAVAAVLVLCAGASRADAQIRGADQPFQGLFGAPESALAAPRSLSVTFAVHEAYDDRLPGIKRFDPDAFRGGMYTQASAGLAFQQRFRHATLGLAGGSRLFHIPRAGDLSVLSHTVGVDLFAELGPRTTLQIAQGVGYSPFHRFRFEEIPGTEALGEDPGFVITAQRTLSLRTSAAVVRQLSARSQFSADFRRVAYDFLDEDLDLRRHYAGARYTYALSPTVGLHAGYRFRTYDTYATPRASQRHDIDVGADYNRSLPLTRHTTVSFGFGSSLMSMDREQPGDGRSETRYFRLIGQATLVHELGRTWRAQAAYDRGLQYVEAVGDPFFADTVSLSLGGYLNRRVDFLGYGSYSHGQLRLSERNRGRELFASTARLRVALTRNLALESQYFFFHYWFAPGVQLGAGYPRELDRQGVRLGLIAWLPLVP